MEPTEAEKFFDSLPKEADEPQFDIFKETPAKEEPKVEKEPEKEAPKPEKEPEEPRQTRREKRQEQMRYYENMLASERAAREELSKRLDKFERGEIKEVDPNIRRLLYEVKDPEEGTKAFDSLLQKIRTEAAEDAYQRIRQEREEEDSEVNGLADQIADGLEAIEDRYGVDLQKDPKTKDEFLDFVESISPRNSDDLADMETAWPLFQANRKAPQSPETVARQKQIASRSMQRSSTAKPTPENVRPLTFGSLDSVWERIKGRS